jgi:hypothetical protein
MQTHHWVMMAIILVVGYALGAKFPQWGAKVGL